MVLFKDRDTSLKNKLWLIITNSLNEKDVYRKYLGNEGFNKPLVAPGIGLDQVQERDDFRFNISVGIPLHS